MCGCDAVRDLCGCGAGASLPAHDCAIILKLEFETVRARPSLALGFITFGAKRVALRKGVGGGAVLCVSDSTIDLTNYFVYECVRGAREW